MGVLTSEHPKCMTEVSGRETILSRQLTQLAEKGIEEVVMTTGLFDTVLEEYCKSLELPLTITFVKNPVYDISLDEMGFGAACESSMEATANSCGAAGCSADAR